MTVGDTAQYLFQFLEELLIFAGGLCMIEIIKASGHAGKCAANILLLTREEELVVDLSFLQDFDIIFFSQPYGLQSL